MAVSTLSTDPENNKLTGCRDGRKMSGLPTYLWHWEPAHKSLHLGQVVFWLFFFFFSKLPTYGISDTVEGFVNVHVSAHVCAKRSICISGLVWCCWSISYSLRLLVQKERKVWVQIVHFHISASSDYSKILPNICKESFQFLQLAQQWVKNVPGCHK